MTSNEMKKAENESERGGLLDSVDLSAIYDRLEKTAILTNEYTISVR
jgi:hypothetical protein